MEKENFASSAGVKITPKINPAAIEVMKEKGIDISLNKPKILTVQLAKNADLIITMGCKVADLCPGPALKTDADWGLEDPKDKPIEKVREIRNEIEKRVRKLIDETV